MNKIVKITNNIDMIEQYQRDGVPCILLLDETNKDKDTSKAKYCALLDEEDMSLDFFSDTSSDISLTEDKDRHIREILGDDYLNLVEARCFGKPLVIANTDRLIIREFISEDVNEICNIYEGKDTGFIQAFYESKDDAKRIIDKYINEVYDFYGYGLWAVLLKETEELIGVVGFTPRESSDELIDIELGYAIGASHRRKGYGYEAVCAAIDYAKSNLEYHKILIYVNNQNIPGKTLGNKIKVLTSDVIFCSIDEADK